MNKSILDEVDIHKYFELLDQLKNNCIIVIAVKDTPGIFIDETVAKEMLQLGYKESLQDKHWHSYIGILDAGNVVYENVSAGEEASTFTGIIDRLNIAVVSKPFRNGNIAEIKLNGTNYSVNMRGLNIVVFEKNSKAVLDSVCFDGHLKDIPCCRIKNEGNDVAIKKSLSELLAIHAAGYDIPKCCIDNKLDNVTIYIEERDWLLVEPICLSFKYNTKIRVKQYISDQGFRRDFEFAPDIGWVITGDINYSLLDETDIVLLLTVQDNLILKESLNKSGVQFFDLYFFIEKMYNYVFFEKYINEYIGHNPDIIALTVQYPYFPYGDRSQNEIDIIEKQIIIPKIQAELMKNPPEVIVKSYDEFNYTHTQILELLTEPPSYYDEYGIRQFEDYSSPTNLVNIVDGHRVTSDVPENRVRTIYYFGNCRDFGISAPDDKTIASYLQRLLNTFYPDRKIAVENYGYFIHGYRTDIFNKMNSLPIRKGDIVIIASPECKKITNINLKDIFQRPHDYGEVFIDNEHYNENGYRAIAGALFKALEKHNFFVNWKAPQQEPCPVAIQSKKKSVVSGEYAEELSKYKKLLLENKKRVGSIVMNCNPFTLGHRYLIEYAAKQVGHLYIFVVEEDKSIFPFADRFELIKAGTQDLPNVTVLPSGKFIISSLTFTDYFNKSKIQDRAIDPSNDVAIFAEEIAPVLNISVRFAGEEPFDNITHQYNDTMKRILPQHGIDFVVIPRKEEGGTPISASRVRKLLEEKNFAEIAKIVPETTLRYLKEKFTE